MMQTPLLQSLAQWNGSASMPPMLAFSPAGMQLSGVNGPGQFTGIQSVGAFMAPFTLTTTVSGLAAEGIPFDVYLVSPDLRQWLSVAGHLGGVGGGRRGGFGISTPFGGVRVPFGGGPSPEYGIWANWTGSGQPISALGNKIYPDAGARRALHHYDDRGADGMASVSLQDPSGLSLGALNAMPVVPGRSMWFWPRRKFGPTFANWQSVQLTPLGRRRKRSMTAPPETPTLDYFQAHLTPYGQWVDVPGIGAAWVPAEANNPRLAALHGCGPLGIHRRRLVLAVRLSLGRYRLSLWALDQQRFYGRPMGLGAGLSLGAVVGCVAGRRGRHGLGAAAVGSGLSRRTIRN